MRLLFAAMFLALFAVPSVAVAQEPKAEEKDKVKIDPETKRAIDAALRFLAKEQNADGSWGNTAITGFVLLAFMSNGNLPNQGEYGKNVDRGVKFLLSCDSRGDGYIVGYKGGNMYCHGMATLALTQVYGMTGDEDVKKVTKKAIDLIIKTQNPEGGWRYDPSPTGADISVTIMQVMALRGAKDAGLNVPDKTIKDSLKYIERCRDGRTGGYKYQPYAVGAASHARPPASASSNSEANTRPSTSPRPWSTWNGSGTTPATTGTATTTLPTRSTRLAAKCGNATTRKCATVFSLPVCPATRGRGSNPAARGTTAAAKPPTVPPIKPPSPC